MNTVTSKIARISLKRGEGTKHFFYDFYIIINSIVVMI